MLTIPLEFTGQVMANLDPMKTVRAIQAREMPPLICLVCLDSDQRGQCQRTDVDIGTVIRAWQLQLTISPTDFTESLAPNTLLKTICSSLRQEGDPTSG